MDSETIEKVDMSSLSYTSYRGSVGPYSWLRIEDKEHIVEWKPLENVKQGYNALYLV